MSDVDPSDPILRPVPDPERDDTAQGRPPGMGGRPGRDDGGWEAVVREELLRLRRRGVPGPRAAPLPRRRGPGEPPAAA